MKERIKKEINNILYNKHNKLNFLPIDCYQKALRARYALDEEPSEEYDLIRDFLLIEENKEPRFSRLGVKFQYLKKEFSRRIKNYTLDKTTLEVMSILSSFSKNSSMVGGSVRDIILKKKPKDFDFVTDINYDRIKNIFKEHDFQVKEVGKQFLVVIVSKNGMDYEIANFRKDGTYKDGRRPESVEIGTIFDDAKRRDFTINAIYYNLLSKEVIDPNLEGIFDIENKVLKFIGNPEDRIQEDYLRVIRFYRFISKTKFTPDKRSLKEVRRNFEDAQKKVSSERFRNEIERIIGL